MVEIPLDVPCTVTGSQVLEGLLYSMSTIQLTEFVLNLGECIEEIGFFKAIVERFSEKLKDLQED